MTDSVNVAVSCGKDSTALLDLCVEHFPNVAAYHLYMVKGLSYMEAYLSFLERRYGLSIMRIPHWALSLDFRNASFRWHTLASKEIQRTGQNDIERLVRERTGYRWVAYGHKQCDSLQRRGMLSKTDGIDIRKRRAYPIAFWNDALAFSYLKWRGIPLSPEYGMLKGGSFGFLHAANLAAIKRRYPADYERILEVFPFAEAAIFRAEVMGVQVPGF